MQNASSNTRIARNSVFLTIRMFIVLFITLYTTRVLLASLGVADYGVYNVVCGFVSMFSFLNTSMTNGIQRFYNYSIGDEQNYSIKDVYNTALKIQFILAIIIVVLTETFGIWYLYNKMVIPPNRFNAALWIFQFSIISFVFIIMQVPYSASIMAKERMDFYALVGVVDAFLKLGIAFSVSKLKHDKLIIYGFLLLSVSLINFLLYFIYAKKSFPELKIQWKRKNNLFKSMLCFSGWNIFGSFSGMMKEQGINLILNLFFGPVVNAARGIANQVNGGLQSLVANMSTAIRPQVIQSFAAKNTNRTLKLTYSISKISCSVLYMISWPIIIEIKYILDIWLGGVIPEHTSTFVVIIIMISFINNLNSAVSGVIHASGKMMLYQTVSCSVSLLCIPAAYFALKNGAVPEVALISVFVFATFSHITSLFILKTIIKYSIKDYCKKIVQPLFKLIIISFTFPLIPHFLITESFGRLIIVLCVSIIVELPIFYLLTLDKTEQNMMRSLIKSIIKRIK